MNDWINAPCAPLNNAIAAQAQQRQMQLTKPPGSLGRMEEVAITLAAMQGKLAPLVENIQIAVFAADHGVMAEDVSAFPQAVTGEMVKNFVRGGAAIAVLAKQLGAGLTVVNAGIIGDVADDFGAGIGAGIGDAGDLSRAVVNQPIAAGTQNLASTAAMSAAQCAAALALGKQLIDGYSAYTDLVIGGEMGIGNTTAATALAAALGVDSAANLVGPGTGLDAQGLARKLSVVERALARLPADLPTQTLLAELGGFEILALSGFYLRAAQRGFPVLVDGFIASTAALAAVKLNSGVSDWLLFAHTSAEPGHQRLLAHLNAAPLLSLGMRLGEGSAAAIAANLLQSACNLQNNMATFAEAGVTDG